MSSEVLIDDLVTIAEQVAQGKHDGHLTLMRFTSGWKVMFGTPELSCASLEEVEAGTFGGGYGEVQNLPTYPTLREALSAMLRQVEAAP